MRARQRVPLCVPLWAPLWVPLWVPLWPALLLLVGSCGPPEGNDSATSEAQTAAAEQVAEVRHDVPTPPGDASIVPPDRIPRGTSAVEGTCRVSRSTDGRTWIRGTLIDESGRPVPGAKVWIDTSDGIRHLQASDLELGPTLQCIAATTDAQGRFEMHAPYRNDWGYALVARAPRMCELRIDEIEAPRGHDLDLGVRVLRRGVPFELEVVDPDGRPVPGVGLAQIWFEGSQAWFAYPQWLGETDANGTFRTDRLPSLDALIDGYSTGWLYVVVPGQFAGELPLIEWRDAPDAPRRFVLPRRAWFEGRVHGMVPAERYAVSTGGRYAFGLPLVDRNYPPEHPIRSNVVPVVETDGTFRIPTWSGGGDPNTLPRLTLHMLGHDGRWFEISSHQPWWEVTDGHDMAFSPVDLQVPAVARLTLLPSRWTDLEAIVSTSPGGWQTYVPGEGGDIIVPVPRGRESDGAFEIELRSPGHGRIVHEVTAPHAARIVDLGTLAHRPLEPQAYRYVDAATKEPIAGVHWTVVASELVDHSARHVGSGVTRGDGLAAIPSEEMMWHSAVPPEGYRSTGDGAMSEEAGEEDVFVQELERAPAFDVLVLDAERRPVEGAVVRALDAVYFDYAAPLAVTDRDGRAVVHTSREDLPVVRAYPAESLVESYDYEDDPLLEWWLPDEGTPPVEDGTTTLLLRRAAPYWIHATTDGAPAPDLRFAWWDDDHRSYPADGERPGVMWIELAPIGAMELDLFEASTRVLALLDVAHPGSGGRLEVDMSAGTLTGVIGREDDGSPEGIEVELELLVDRDQLDDTPLRTAELRARTVVDSSGRFELPVRVLGAPARLHVTGRRLAPLEIELDPFRGGEWRDVNPAPLGPAGTIRVVTAPNVDRRLRVQVWLEGDDDGENDFGGMHRVAPGRPTFVDGLPTGSYEVDVVGTFHVLRTYSVDVVVGEMVDLVIED